MFLCGVAGAQEAKVRTSLATQGELWVGQSMTLVVELLAPGYFSSVAAFDLPNAPGALLAPPAGSPVVSSETIDGASYTVQRHELMVFARRAGEQTIRSFGIRFQFKRNPLDKESAAAAVKTEPVSFTAKVPPGAERLGNVISARSLKVEETWQPEPGKAKAGNAFTRTITYTAPEVPAMAFPPFPAGQIDGLGIYLKPPEVLDESDRGRLIGKRRDTTTYVCQRAGTFTLPAARLTWFDLEAKQLQTIDFPARSFEVAPNPAMVSTVPVASDAPHPDDAQLVVAALVGALGLNAVAIVTWLMRARWRPLFDVFRPVHLAPLNPAQNAASAPYDLWSSHRNTMTAEPTTRRGGHCY